MTKGFLTLKMKKILLSGQDSYIIRALAYMLSASKIYMFVEAHEAIFRSTLTGYIFLNIFNYPLPNTYERMSP